VNSSRRLLQTDRRLPFGKAQGTGKSHIMDRPIGFAQGLGTLDRRPATDLRGAEEV
jgi:hypothetical protein